ncbi:MAG TPA: hypothetical protein VGH07_01875 [Chthoniobacterales bacterium]
MKISTRLAGDPKPGFVPAAEIYVLYVLCVLYVLQLLTPSLLPAAKKLQQNLPSVSDHRIVSKIFHW